MKKYIMALITLFSFTLLPSSASAVGYTIPNYASCIDPALLALGDRICFDETTPYGPRAWVYADDNNPGWYTAYVQFGELSSPGINSAFIDPDPQANISYIIDNGITHTVYDVVAVSPELQYNFNRFAQFVKTPTLWNCTTTYFFTGHYCAFATMQYWNVLYTAAQDPTVEFIYLKQVYAAKLT